VAARKSARLTGATVTLSHPASGVLRDALLRGGILADGAGTAREDDAFWLNGAPQP
jgi:hypothetical protein